MQYYDSGTVGLKMSVIFTWVYFIYIEFEVRLFWYSTFK